MALFIRLHVKLPKCMYLLSSTFVVYEGNILILCLMVDFTSNNCVVSLGQRHNPS